MKGILRVIFYRIFNGSSFVFVADSSARIRRGKNFLPRLINL